MWMRWNETTHIFEQSLNDGASWAVLPLNASILNEGSINTARLPGNIAYKDVNNNFSIVQSFGAGISVTGAIAATSNITSNAGMGCVGSFNSNSTIHADGILSTSALLSVTGSGMSVFAAGAAGASGLRVQNTDPAGGNAGVIQVGNATNPGQMQLLAYSAASGSGGYLQPAGNVIYSGGAGGLSIVADGGGGVIRFYSGGAIERLKIDASGSSLFNTASYANSIIEIAYDEANKHGIGLKCTSTNGNTMLIMSPSGQVGGISQFASSVSFNTTSDIRLKIDKGRVNDLSKLRKVIIHDFEWRIDNTISRGLFAQEAHDLYPEAITKGTDDLNEEGLPKTPWMVDHSKFVPDLIAGWQEHDSQFEEIKNELRSLAILYEELKNNG